MSGVMPILDGPERKSPADLNLRGFSMYGGEIGTFHALMKTP